MNTGEPETAEPERSGTEASTHGWLRWLGVAGLCLAIWGGLTLLWSWREKQRAHEIVLEQFVWNEKHKWASAWEKSQGTSPGAFREVDGRMARALQILGTRGLSIAECPGITSVAALKDIATLKEVDLNRCTGLISVEGLPAGVQRLRLEECTGLTSVEGLPEGVQEINLRWCTGLTSVAGLPAGVKKIDLTGCTGLTRVSGLPSGLQILCLGGCTELVEIGKLPPGLKAVWIDHTPNLPEVVKAEIRAQMKKQGGAVWE